MFLDHFILQTKEDFCTNTLFSSLERGGGGGCCYLLSDEPLSAGDVITQHH